MLTKHSPIALNLAAGIFICRALYSLVTQAETSVYLGELQVGLLFCLLALCTKIYNKT